MGGRLFAADESIIANRISVLNDLNCDHDKNINNTT